MSIKGFVVNGQTVKYDYDALDNKPNIPSGGSGLTDDVKTALLQLASKVAYIDANGSDYYQDLYDALYTEPSATLVSISAVYTQSGTVYDSASLDSLKPDLVVTGHYDDSTSQTVVGYTLSGTLTVGTSTITVSYQGKTTTFNVTVTATPVTYTVTNTLTACTNSNSATTAYSGSSYSGTLTATASDYVITTVSITMGGTDVTGTAYSNGTISIANVTGNIVITAVATQRQATLSSISAVFTQGQNAIYTTDSLDSLKQYLVVTAHWNDSSTSTVSPSDYALSGTLAEGTSTITVSYGGKTTTFNVTVTVLNTSPSIAETGVTLNNDGTTGATTGGCYTNAYAYELDINSFKLTQYYDSTNNYCNTSSALWKIVYNISNDAGISFGARGKNVCLDSNDTSFGGSFSTTKDKTEHEAFDARYNSGYFTLSDNIIHIKFSLSYADRESCYAYWTAPLSGILPVGVSEGDIIFAGSNTPYYGYRNISDVSA